MLKFNISKALTDPNVFVCLDIIILTIHFTILYVDLNFT